MDYILIIKTNVKLDVNPNECRDVKYVSATELKEMFKDECKFFFFFNMVHFVLLRMILTIFYFLAHVFTPWFKLICDSYLFKWWENLDDIAKFRSDEIDRMI